MRNGTRELALQVTTRALATVLSCSTGARRDLLGWFKRVIGTGQSPFVYGFNFCHQYPMAGANRIGTGLVADPSEAS